MDGVDGEPVGRAVEWMAREVSPPAEDRSRWSAAFARAHRLLLERFATHLRLYLVAGGGLTLADLFTGAGWWSFTPVFGWGGLLAVHYCYVRAANVDDEWVRERTTDLKVRSYDLGHITDLEERIQRGDDSVRPATERRGRDGSDRGGRAC